MSDIERAVKALRNPTKLIAESRESVIVYRDDLEAVLDRLAELEEQDKGKTGLESLDLTSELEVGDEVVALTDYMELRRGMHGKVVNVKPYAPYPIEVQFEGIDFFYLKNGTVGFHRNELGKVKNAI